VVICRRGSHQSRSGGQARESEGRPWGFAWPVRLSTEMTIIVLEKSSNRKDRNGPEPTDHRQVDQGSAHVTRARRAIHACQRSSRYSSHLTVMLHLRRSRLPRLISRPRLRSFVHSEETLPSSAYLDSGRGHDVCTGSTPDDLSSSQRRVLEAALRVDQAGEVAANYIYKGQLAVLRHDPATASLIQASPRHLTFCITLNCSTLDF
jgi:hypothetical protein